MAIIVPAPDPRPAIEQELIRLSDQRYSTPFVEEAEQLGVDPEQYALVAVNIIDTGRLLISSDEIDVAYPEINGLYSSYLEALKELDLLSFRSDRMQAVVDAMVKVIRRFAPTVWKAGKLPDIDAALLQTAPQRIQAFLTEVSNQRTLRLIEDRLDKALKALASAGAAHLSTDFEKTANAELRSAKWLRALSFFLLGLALTVAVITAVEHVPENSGWQHIVTRLAIAVPLLGGAYFASSEARDHRRHGRLERGWQIRLDTIGAFLTTLSEPLQEEVRSHFARQLYSEPPDLGASETLADSNERLLSQIVDIVKASQGQAGEK